MTTRIPRVLCAALVWIAAFQVTEAAEPGPTLLSNLPTGAVASVEVNDLEPLIEQVRSSEAFRKWLHSPVYQGWARNSQGRGFNAGLAVIENQLGQDVWSLAKTLIGHRGTFALYPPAGTAPADFVALIEVKEAAALNQLQEKVKPLVSVPGEKVSAADRPDGGWQINLEDGARVVLNDRWMVVSNNASLLELTLGLLKTPAPASLAHDPNFRQAASFMEADSHVRGWIDLEWFRQEKGGRLSPEKLDNPLGSLLLGGLVELTNISPSAFATVRFQPREVQATVNLLGDSSQLPEPQHFSFSTNAPSAPLHLPKLDGTLGGLTLFRDINQWYEQRANLLLPKVVQDMQTFETNFRGFTNQDFRNDVIAALGSRWTIIAAPQTFAHLKGRPVPELPAFGLIVDLKDPAVGAESLQKVLQTIVTVINIQASQQGREPWVVKTVRHGETPLSVADYAKAPPDGALPAAYNVTPAMARVGSQFVLTTSPDLCRSLIDTLQQNPQPAAPTPAVDNLLLEFDPVVAATLMKADQSPLVEKAVRSGKSLVQAQQEFAWWLDVAKQLTPVRLRVTTDAEALRVKLTAGWK